MAEAADLYALAWQQAAQASPSETREQRARLASYKEILGSSRWRNEERRQARDASPKAGPRPEQRTAPRPRPVAEPAPKRPAVAWSSSPSPERRPAARAAPANRGSRPSPRAAEPTLLDAGHLWEIATELRPLLEQTARDGATTNWPAIRKRLPTLPRLHRDDESVILWLADEDRQDGEPLLSALVTVGNRQMHPRFPAIAEQLGLATGRATAQQRIAWSYEVLKVHQHWRYRH